MHNLMTFMRQYPNLIEDKLIKDLLSLDECIPIQESYRNCTYASVQGKLMQEFTNAVNRALPDYYSLCRTLYNCTLIEEPRVLHYSKEQESPQFFDEHADAWDVPSSTRQVSIIAYLNDVEDGGTTVFPHLDLTLTPKAGTVVMFPAAWPYYHFATPPISNDKYVLVTWLHFGTNGIPTFRCSPL